jgi:hypothetical protein
MERTKYVIFDWPGLGAIPILFPSQIAHSEIVNMVQGKSPGIGTISAGWVSPELDCYGHSQSIRKYHLPCSLGLKSIPEEDAKWIKLMFKKEY